MDSSDDSIEVNSDEITEREAKARKRSLNMKLTMQSEKIACDRGDMQTAYKKQFSEIQRLTTLVNELELELRSARFEIGHSVLLETKKNEEISVLQSQHRSVVNELQSKLEEKEQTHNEQMTFILKEADKLSSLVSSVHSSVSDSNQYLEYKSCKQLLLTASKDAANLKSFVSHAFQGTSNEKGQNASRATNPINNNAVVVTPASSSSLDRTLMDICHSLEEENTTLSSSLDQLKRRLAAAEEEVAKNNLIPHYRLAIVRARAYTANLLEQLKREQFTSESLRDQLEVTYADLKKMSEEKRSLYRKMSKQHLEMDRHDLDQQQKQQHHRSPGDPPLNIDRYRETYKSSSRNTDPLDLDLPISTSRQRQSVIMGGVAASGLLSLDQEIADLQLKLSASEY